MDSFELFHIESEKNMIAAVDEFIEGRKQKDVVMPTVKWPNLGTLSSAKIEDYVT